MTGDIQSFAFLIHRDAQADNHIDQFIGDNGDEPRPDDGHANAPALADHLING